VLDRYRLEQLSCECYRAVKRETDRLLPRPPKLRRIQTLQPESQRRSSMCASVLT
jgi:hypothetical protein